MTALDRLSVAGIAAEVQAGKRSAVAVIEDVLARLDAYDAIQPAVWISRFEPDALRAAAAAVDARIAAGETLPLAGVPFAVKDNIDLAGLATTAACPAFAYQPEQSATVVAKLVAAGAIPVGKANLDQFATGLNGTRSPYGIPRNAYNRAWVSGGSSSGSAVAVAAGLVAFALGTDTAGSGRVPAAFNHLVGLKPSKGRWSSSGLVPACRTLDCITVFAGSTEDAALVDTIAAGFDATDSLSRDLPDVPRARRRIGVPRAEQCRWFGDIESEFLYHQALAGLDAELVEIDLAPLDEAARLLYDGPWVAERTAALQGLLLDDPDAIHPVVREIVDGGFGYSAIDAFNGAYRLAELARMAEAMWEQVDLLALPTAPTSYRVAEMVAEPIRLNASLGAYTNFVNLLDMAAIAVPTGSYASGVGFGVTLMGPAGTDRALLDAANAFFPAPASPPPLDLEGRMETVKLAVVGAHLKGMPLHWQLTSREAKFVEATTTAPTYKLYAMAESVPPKPALVHSEDGAAIALEVYELDMAAFGSFVAEVPPPLAIGTVTLADGSMVKGFVAEPRAMAGAEDITELGGWRAYIARG
ncbi:allophanate hydrolase [Sphingomonas sp. NFR04]|uniref:allophanate hydrolase n=1 Tax=Sphingomonas sp. NFR04 TaxID=1566283 RepID=UPI0008E4359D|nr:allophanate hydrolase [Sphingomonas sp. NFR04]SFK49706.1 allophanate hydrolase [Sphingomonas sp. NFR04]